MAYVPLSGTNVRILADVPFSNDYKNTRWFTSSSNQYNWFNNKTRVYEMSKVTFQGFRENKSYISVSLRIDLLYNASYIMFQNADYGNKWFYAFVTELEYKNVGTTYVHFEIDVLQTWMFDIKFQESFIVREHVKLWNDDGTPTINTIDEGLSYGSEYDIVSVENHKPYDDMMFLVIISKSIMHGTPGEEESRLNDINASLNGMPQPLCYYIHPFYKDGKVPKTYIGDNNANLSPIVNMLTNIFSQKSAVNDIVNMYVTDYIGLKLDYKNGDKELKLDKDMFEQAGIADDKHGNVDTIFVKKIPDYEALEIDTGDKWGGFTKDQESKLMMYPYCVTEITDFKGNHMNLKTEYINNSKLKIQVRGSLGVSNKVAYSVQDYNADSSLSGGNRLTASLDSSLINNNPNDIAILNDYLSAYLQGNKNSLENQKSSILFNGIMGMIGGGISAGASAAGGSALGMASSVTGMTSTAGNAVLQMQAMQAKQADIANIPPQLTKMGGNTAFDYGNGYRGVYIIKKQLKAEYRRSLSSFFHKYGYKINRVKKPNLRTRKAFNYVQTKDCFISGDINNNDLQEIRTIFDNGITLWHTDNIGNYSVENELR